MGRVYRVIDTAVLVICLPLYAVVTPLILAEQWFRQRRKVRIGMEVTHWPTCDVREDFTVVDMSRVSEGLAGIRRRKWSLLGGDVPPPYADAVDFIPVARFWVPEPFRLGGRALA